MSAKDDNELCDLFERVLDLRKLKCDFHRLAFSQGLVDEDEEIITRDHIKHAQC